MRGALLVVMVALAAAALGISGSTRNAAAQQPAVANLAPAPPLGGLTQVVAGTSDIEALIEAQTFDVESVWRLDIATQQFEVYIPGAPAFVNTLTSLNPSDIVTIKATATLRYTPARTDGLDYAYAQSLGTVINQIRREHGLSELRIEPKLQAAAELYVEYLHSGNPYVVVPDKKYPIHYQDGSPYTRAVREGYDGRVAEVIILSRGGGSSVPTPDRSARAWLESPDHTAVILDPLREDLGVGCFQAYYDESEFGVLLTIFCAAELAEPF